ncbi:hypothetical protein [Butyricimonas sp. RTP31023st2_F12_RTP31023_210422]|uniref:hypothetical protein n=1 Tax=Butyricimonas sp. RTP31023st2_F12_RTP31023_210422 TaxID=3143211 RepID=UPI0034A46D88
MLPYSTRVGFFFEQVRRNRPFSEINRELKSQAKKVETQQFYNCSGINYILKSNLWGIQEFITVKHIYEEVVWISLQTDNKDEYRQIESYVHQLSSQFPVVQRQGSMTIYTIGDSGLLLGLSPKNMMNKDNTMIVFKPE